MQRVDAGAHIAKEDDEIRLCGAPCRDSRDSGQCCRGDKQQHRDYSVEC